MLATILAVALLSQAPATNDHLFSLSVEDSVHTMGRVKQFREVLQPHHARLIGNMACGRYDCREEAESSLRALGDKGFRAAYWASKSTDKELAFRADGILATFFRCDHCHGNGRCPNRVKFTWNSCEPCRDTPGPSRDDWRDRGKCLVCFGSGDSRPSKQGEMPAEDNQ